MRRRRESSILYAFINISPLPYPVLLIVALVLLLLGISSYISYESVLEDVGTQVNFVMLVIPVLIVFVLRWLSTVGDERNVFEYLLHNRNWKYHDRQRRPSEGSSPLWVAALLVLLLVMITFQSTFHEQWLIFGTW